jgi:hypothetical protein
MAHHGRWGGAFATLGREYAPVRTTVRYDVRQVPEECDMRGYSGIVASIVVVGLMALAGAAEAQEGKATIAGIAFVGSDVTGQGTTAKLPEGTKVLPPGVRVTGTEGCPTTQYDSDGLIVAVIDYAGRRTAANITVNLVPPPQFGARPPYFFDLDAGRKLQFLGPVADNGTYSLTLEWFVGQGQRRTVTVEFTLDRNCPVR